MDPYQALECLVCIRAQNLGDRKMAQTNQISLLAQLLPVEKKIDQITKDKARKYVSEVTLESMIRAKVETVVVPLMFEVQMGFLWRNTKDEFTSGSWQAHFMGGEVYFQERYTTPESIKSTLAAIRVKHALVPNWDYFNFDGVVYILAGMLGTLSMDSKLSTADFRSKKPYCVKGVNQMSDLISVLDEGSIFVDPRFAADGRGSALWAFITAANIAGAKVIMPYADCDSDGRVITREYQGTLLANGITVALNLLGSYYSMANLGDVFALAVTKGIHKAVTVVSHSDEGGVSRDLLRVGQYAPPFGGVPTGIAPSSGMPVVDGHFYEEVCSVVDSIALLTAGLVAHCDPMVRQEDELFPTTLSLPETATEDAKQWTTDERGAVFASLYYERIHGFAANYARGLATLFNLQTDPVYPRAVSQLVGAAAFLVRKPSRHFCAGDVLVPFFWIEPTTLLPKRFLNTDAEQAGSGSLGGWGDVEVQNFVNNATQVGVSDSYQSDWHIDFKSARTSLFITYALNHCQDGLAMFNLKAFDSSRLCLARLSSDEIRVRKINDGYVNPGDLVWRRGQSKLPHPGEVLNIDGRMGITVYHSKIDGRGYTVPISHIPRADEFANVQVKLRASKLKFWMVGNINAEHTSVKRQRNRGIIALERAQFEVLKVVKLIKPGVEACECPPPRGPVKTEMKKPDVEAGRELVTKKDAESRKAEKTNTEDEGTKLEAKPQAKVSTAKPDVKTEPRESKGEPVEVARQHGALVAPKPHEPTAGTAPVVVAGPPGNTPARGDNAAGAVAGAAPTP